MRTIDNYIGLEPFLVLIDDFPKLRSLAAKARELKNLPFKEKLEAVKKLALDSMINAYEQIVLQGRKADYFSAAGLVDSSEYKTAQEQYERFRNIVFQKHKFSYALEQEA